MREYLNPKIIVTANLLVDQMDLDPDEWDVIIPPPRALDCPCCIQRLLDQFPCDVSSN